MRPNASGHMLRLNVVRTLVLACCACGMAALAAGVVAPLGGAIWAMTDPAQIGTELVGTPAAWALAQRSLTLSATATAGALLLGLFPAAVLGSCSRRQWPWLLGLVLSPLIVPPQVYAYAWGLLGAAIGRAGFGGVPKWEETAVRAGLISAGWLWPVVTLVIASGWRSTGRAVYRLALLDTSSLNAFFRAVLPSLRPQLIAAAGLVAGITIIEYPIPHLTLCRVWATELMVLVEVRAPYGQIIRMAAQPVAATILVLVTAALLTRGSSGWQPLSEEDATPDSLERLNKGGWPAWAAAAIVWLATLGIPVGLMVANLRVPRAWMQGLTTFSDQWADSLQIAIATGLMSIVVAIGSIGWWQASGRRFPRWAAVLTVATATFPPAALGIGFVVVYNRSGWIGDLYAERPVVWTLALVARYAAVAVAVTWLSLGRRKVVAVEQARVDGGNSLDILGHVLLPMLWPSLVSAGLIVTLLALFEVVVTQMTRPPGYGSIAMTILNYMHYGRDDAVITTALTLMVAGIVLTQVCGHLLGRKA